MKLLGIDYGRSKIGLALATSAIAEPLKVAKFDSEKDLIKKVGQIVQVEKVDKIVVGVSEGEMAEESKKFGRKLEEEIGVEVNFSDETLTTEDAQLLAISAGVSRKKRRGMEDAYAAALILQNYLDLQT